MEAFLGPVGILRNGRRGSRRKRLDALVRLWRVDGIQDRKGGRKAKERPVERPSRLDCALRRARRCRPYAQGVGRYSRPRVLTMTSANRLRASSDV